MRCGTWWRLAVAMRRGLHRPGSQPGPENLVQHIGTDHSE